MRGRWSRTVRIAAASAGMAAALTFGLARPSPRLAAQTPGTPAAKSAAGETIPEIPTEKKGDGGVAPPARTEPEPNPLPPALPTFSAPSPELPQANTTAVTQRASSRAEAAAEGALADPEAAAKAFVERSQKEADEAITALSKEAESLRARLQKVEAGLARWQAVKESLGASDAARPSWRGRGRDRAVIPGSVAPGPAEAARPSGEPTILEPIPATADEAKPRPALPAETAPAILTPVKPPEAPPADEAPQPKGVVRAPSTDAPRRDE